VGDPEVIHELIAQKYTIVVYNESVSSRRPDKGSDGFGRSVTASTASREALSFKTDREITRFMFY
jgi:hypothetical protein